MNDNNAIFRQVVPTQSVLDEQGAFTKEQAASIIKAVKPQYFMEVFAAAHADEDHIVPPDEFFMADQSDEVMQETSRHFTVAYKAFLIDFYRRCSKNFSKASIQKVFEQLRGYDIPETVAQHILKQLCFDPKIHP
jgi:hypothetical protein